MENLRQEFAKIPWASFGRPTPISALARSVLPVGNFPSPLPSREAGMVEVELGQPDFEKYLMNILGTAFQVGRGKLLTCWHVCQALKVDEGRAYVQATAQRRDGAWFKDIGQFKLSSVSLILG